MMDDLKGKAATHMKRISVLAGAAAALFVMLISPVSAAADSFARVETRDGDRSAIIAREIYEPTRSITADTLGLERSFEGLTDIYTGRDGKIYVLCGGEGNARIIVLGSDYKLLHELTVTDADGDTVDYSGAQGIFVDKDGRIYVADTNNARVLLLDQSGRMTDSFGVPDSSLIPDDFNYQPTRIAKDDKEYLYVLSNGCYYGALSFAPDGEFLGFYGANTVSATALDTLAFLWDKLTGNDTKKAYSMKKLPYSFVDFCTDPDGFLITCTGKTGMYSLENGEGQIKKITSNGANILYKNSADGSTSASTSFNFLEDEVTVHNNVPRTQNLVAIDTDTDGVMYALDQTYGFVYAYDSECNLLGAFGGGVQEGKRIGTFGKAVALTVSGTDVLIADQENRSITVFRRTDYGQLLYQAQSLYLSGDYVDAEPYWQQVLARDASCQLAYRGLGMASYGNGEYEAALDYAEAGQDYTVYDLAWQATLSSGAAQHFVWIALSVVVLLGGVIWFAVYAKKKQLVLVRSEKVRTYGRVIFHPFDTFTAVKYKQQGSWIIGILLTILLYASFVLKATESGFLFRTATPQSYNALYTLLQTIGLLLLWSVANWLVCSMFSGKGHFHEVFTASTYAFTPLIAMTFLEVILSQFLPLSASGILSGMNTIAWIYSLFLLCIAMMTVHEYDFFKFLATGIGVVFFMVVAVFVVIFLVTMLSLVKEFIGELYEEIVFR